MRYCSNFFVLLQVLSILQEVFPAVEAAEIALKLRPLWWEGWQTLGRAQLNLGEVDLVSLAEHCKKNQNKTMGIPTEPRVEGGLQIKNMLGASRQPISFHARVICYFKKKKIKNLPNHTQMPETRRTAPEHVKTCV